MDVPERRRLLDRLYQLAAEHSRRVGPPRLLRDATGHDGWPSHGVYLVFEPGEYREDGSTPRIVRVGTHGLSAASRATLWGRLRTHRGSKQGRSAGGGSHRASVFRLHVGTALINRGGTPEAAPTWAQGSSAPPGARDRELELERAVSEHISSMEVLAIEVADRHDRAAVERSCIALLSNAGRPTIDPPSRNWLGHDADRASVRRSGLWNVNYVEAVPSPSDLDVVWRHLER